MKLFQTLQKWLGHPDHAPEPQPAKVDRERPYVPAGPDDPAEILYAYGDFTHGPTLLVQMPWQFQSWTHHRPKRVEHAKSFANTHYGFTYLKVVLSTGEIFWMRVEQKLFDLKTKISFGVQDKAAQIEMDAYPWNEESRTGWSFLLGAIELVNTEQFLNHLPPPANFFGHVASWDIAAMMENGERALFARSAHPQGVMLKLSNQLRMLLAPIQAAQRPNRSDHIRLFKLIKAGDNGTDRQALQDKLAAHYRETFRPPELLF